MASCLCDYRHPTELKTYLDTLGTLSDGEVVCRVLSKTTLLVTKDGVCVWVPAHPSGDSPLFLALQSNQTDIPQSCFGAIALVQYKLLVCTTQFKRFRRQIVCRFLAPFSQQSTYFPQSIGHTVSMRCQ